MQSLLDALIFPAPASSYSQESLLGKLIYIPKFKEYEPDLKVFESNYRRRKNTVEARLKSLNEA
jgi:hypothetical protein